MWGHPQWGHPQWGHGLTYDSRGVVGCRPLFTWTVDADVLLRWLTTPRNVLFDLRVALSTCFTDSKKQQNDHKATPVKVAVYILTLAVDW